MKVFKGNAVSWKMGEKS